MTKEIEKLEAEILLLEKEQESLREQYKKLGTQISRTANKIEKKLEAIASFKQDDFGYLLFQYKVGHDLIKKFVPDKWFLQSYGYWTDTKEIEFKIALYKDEEIPEEVYEFFDLWKVHTKEKKISVFRHDLCEEGLWEIHWDQGDVFSVCYTSFGYQEDPEMTGTLKEVLEYCKVRHYYE